MNQLEFKKISLDDKRLIMKTLEFYFELYNPKMEEIEKSYLNIVFLFKSRLKTQIEKPYPAKKSTLKFHYFEGSALKCAIYHYQINGNPNNLENAILERYKISLIQQLF